MKYHESLYRLDENSRPKVLMKNSLGYFHTQPGDPALKY